MKILNPLYDWAFKYLLDNNDLAKKFISAILKLNITHLETRNIELPLLKEGNPWITRFDFKAIIESNGKTEEVLIEVQKYRSPDPIDRFRTYLGESYMKKESYKTGEGKSESKHLPIIAVYILGYCPSEFTVPYIIVRNNIYDGVSEKELTIESKIINLLTHRAYFLTAVPPKGYKWRGTRQEAIIRLFRQKLQGEESNTIYELEEEPNDAIAKEIVTYLHRGTENEEIVKQLKAEEEYYKSLQEMEFDLEQERKEKEEALKQAEQQRKRAEQERKRAEQERKRAEEFKKQEKEAKIKLAQKMLKYGESIEEIMKETGLSREEIEKI